MSHELNTSGVTVIALQGELDTANCELIVEHVRCALVEPLPSAVVLDMSAVSFMDSTALGKIISARLLCKSLDIALWIRDGSPRVRRVLEITNLTELIEEPCFRTA
jgi:anti-anti-sigma factor